ncbi:hypothetical protein [Deinococcus humi]|uniref:Uncharacterized protein n=1 Tax=Deinococcus humi TaxID=662880 RepID=A0A7W8JXT4_9DEIO|nr:hypothetical protein [Deinococcus humi]MBB5365217.1 hypothetical protein [Deinococcus humi]GGO35643.1 hypothetical protein GCM10008949_38430 [Deinococcus humi]
MEIGDRMFAVSKVNAVLVEMTGDLKQRGGLAGACGGTQEDVSVGRDGTGQEGMLPTSQMRNHAPPFFLQDKPEKRDWVEKGY